MKFKQVIINKLYDILEPEIIDNLQIGGHCGLCGKWVPDEILPKSWAITLCSKCAKGDFS